MKINNYVPDTRIFDNMSSGAKNNVEKDTASSTSFGDLLKSKLDEVNDAQVNANNLSEQFVEGKGEDISKVSLAVSEASLSLDMAIELRNKLVDAYQELNRMQL